VGKAIFEMDELTKNRGSNSGDGFVILPATPKLEALAEFAAGAGHEINNPLAVISGQAQYVLKQMDWLDVPSEEIENVGEYLDNLRTKITPSLNKIIGQTQRIHAILTELMQFARPGVPKLQTLSVQSLIQGVADSLQKLAQERKVRLVCQELGRDEMVRGDVAQVRVALNGLLRNAIEAAPLGGWAGVRYEKKDADTLELIVEDDGSGPALSMREHLFDPFFSGRSAGRGRGLGLPTAWRLARQQGGDVRFDGVLSGTTRFILTLPLATLHSAEVELNGRNGVHPLVEAHP
jgi:signal transduction histidine kinase